MDIDLEINKSLRSDFLYLSCGVLVSVGCSVHLCDGLYVEWYGCKNITMTMIALAIWLQIYIRF